uniref:CCT domain-containing protein n=1 Tax=Oryza glumipatula TaxID=40148 RepID=A0A0E0AY70_9ORYZ
MKDGGGGGGRGQQQQWPCDYCGEAAAALHCRADAARLCVACDRHVHAANALSRKHVRAPLCAACAARPAAARVASASAPAFLCADCDTGCGGDDGAALRVPVEGFSGCPAAAELAASWGLDLPGGCGGEEEEADDAFFSALDYSMLAVDPVLRDLYVPCDPPEVVVAGGGGRRLKGEALGHQLAEMARREAETAHPHTQPHSDLSPRTPRRTSAAASGRLQEKQAPPPLPHAAATAAAAAAAQEAPLPYTSLLMMAPANCTELMENDRVGDEDENVLWESTAPSVPPTQIWDFNLGKSRDHNENSALEVGFGSNNGGFMIKSYNDMLKEISSGTTKDLEDIYDSRYCAAAEDIMSTNVCQLSSKNPSTGSNKRKVSSCASTIDGPTTSTSHVPAASGALGGSSNDRGSALPKEISFCDQTVVPTGADQRPCTIKIDSETLAQNRDNAMQRYEKHIRYESRKLRADTRKRVKGRFVKSNGAHDDVSNGG